MKTHPLMTELKDELSKLFKDWDVKGIIDSTQEIMIVSQDTKLLSKVFELRINPVLFAFAKKHGLEIEPAKTQIQYPDFSLRGKALGSEDKWVAVDVKSTYFKSGKISGFTLGSFRGCMRERTTTRFSRFPYNDYSDHYCLCIIYDRVTGITEERAFSIKDINKIPRVIKNVEVHIHHKYKIAGYGAGSGNTANIGSVSDINQIRKGCGPFAKLGHKVFEHYWLNYMRKEDAIRAGLKQAPYNNLTTYLEYLKNKKK